METRESNSEIMANSVISGREADLLIYGEISDEPTQGKACSREIVKELLQLEKTCDKVRIRVNSQGGEVYPGIAIFNAIRRAKCDIDIYTDGVSASIAGIIALCGRKHYMGRYSRLMIHAVSGGVFGNIPDLQRMIEEIANLEKTLSEIISERMQITPEEARLRFFDGSDHWFTAEEAVNLGLADGVFDEEIPGAATMSAGEIYNKVLLNRSRFVKQSETGDNWMKDKIIKLLGLADGSPDNEVYEAVKELYDYAFSVLEKRGGKEGAEKKVSAFGNRWGKRTLLIERIVEDAVKERRVSYKDKEKIAELGLEIGPVALSQVIGMLPKKRLVSEDLKQDSFSVEETKTNSKLEYYRKNKPEYLRKHPEAYRAMIEEHFNK